MSATSVARAPRTAQRRSIGPRSSSHHRNRPTRPEGGITMSPITGSDQGSAQVPSYPHQLASGAIGATRDRARAVFGQVMGLVALTLGCVALGAYLGRNLTGGAGIAFFVGSFGCIVGLSLASSRGREQLATTLLFGLGLLLGLAVGPVIADYASADPAALWQAAGATGAFVATLGG